MDLELKMGHVEKGTNNANTNLYGEETKDHQPCWIGLKS